MAFTVDFYNFAKAVNSTKRPAASAGLICNCVLKNGCSIYQPEIELQISLDAAPLYNYAFIPDFDRYYFINDWTFSGRLWTASMVCDVLGSWKNTIGAQQKYVLRSSAQYDLLIKDDFYPVKGDGIGYQDPGATWWTATSYANSGCYVVAALAGDDAYTLGNGISYFIMDSAGFRNFTAAILSNSLSAYDSDGSIANLGNSLAKLIVNPFEYIKSVKWYPFTIPPSIAVPANNLVSWKVGFWTFTHTVGSIYAMPAASYVTLSDRFTLRKHPYTQTRGACYNGAPYTFIQLKLPRLGFVPVDVNRLIASDVLDVVLRVDLASGEGKYEIIGDISTSQTSDEQRYLATYSISAGVDIPLTQSFVSLVESVSNIAEASMGAAALMTGAGGIEAAGAAISGITRLYEPHLSQVGGQPGSFLGIVGDGQPYIYYEFYYTTNEDLQNFGRPLCQTVTLSGIPGYIRCLDGHIEIADAFRPELEQISNYLETGFYYE